ncbi:MULTISPECIES: hypothetical protein [unclassified Nonomuraea]|uniref:hypothetical protein n=1 Tax=Nonomuraea sp. NPDC047529 TaxID=3155623 RepID=UPI0033CE8379
MTASVPSPEDGEPLPYKEVTDEAYARLAAGSFTVEEPRPGTLILRGPCPRCRAPIEIPLVSGIVRSPRAVGERLRRRPRPQQETVEPMMCTCEDDHPNRPEGRYGCGAYWTLTVSAGPR